MRRSFLALLAVCAAAAAVPAALPAQDAPLRHGLWIGFGLGGGQVEWWADQQTRTRQTTVTGSLRGGIVVTPHLRLGIEANGWGLETSNPNDPAKGETVNETLAIAQWYPWAARGLYLKAGYGIGSYSNNNPGAWGSRALGAWAVGTGYELRVARNVFVTLAADWASGPLGSVDNLVTTSTGRRFRAWDLILGVQYH